MALAEDVPSFLKCNGAPVTEELTLTELTVKGTLPPELDGRYLRNGGNPVTGVTDHPFLGDGMVHGIRLRDGKAEWYRNRYVQTPFLENPTMQATDPEAIMDMACSKANTSIIAHAGRILALEEGHFPYVMDGELNTLGPLDFAGKLTGSFTAHPKICPVTGELLAFGYSVFPPYLTYLRVSPGGDLVQVEHITTGGPTMMHDFNVTEHHVIFMDLPAVFDLEKAMAGGFPIGWGADYPARLGVMPRTGTDADVTWYEIEPCYVFHPMNAYEAGGNIVLDVARLDHIWRDSPMDFPAPNLYRWTIDTAAGKVHEEQADDRPAEFPRVPDALVGQRHRYGYMTSADLLSFENPANNAGAVVKYDRATGTETVLTMANGRQPGEVVFVPAAGGTGEDAGYLMTYVYDAFTHRSEFVVFDGETMDAEPVASVALPRIPFGFHGSWIPADQAG